MIAEFEVLGKPMVKKRPRVVNGHAFTPKDTVLYENYVRMSYQFAKQPYLTGSIYAEITAYFDIPASWSKKKKEEALNGQIPRTERPDLDNIAKAVLDALNGVAYKDDSQIVSLKVEKTYGEVQKVVVRLSEGAN